MPCYQSNNLPSGVTTTGRTSYTTEADCVNACKEGACCEGTTCTVKPLCQCQCTTGSCCGPDMFTNAAGETGPRCRTETKSQCESRGGTFRCGVGCVNPTDEGGGAPRPGIGICLSLDGSPSAPVFKGFGTTCTPNPCPCIGACCGPSPHFYYAGRYECEHLTQAACAAKGGNWSGCNTGCPATDEVNVPTDRGCASFNPLP